MGALKIAAYTVDRSPRFICQRCGCLVVLVQAHSDFHDRVDPVNTKNGHRR